MATIYKDAQVVGTASTGTYSTLYSTGASTTAVISSIIICNEATSAVTIRVGIAASAGTPASGSFILYDRTIPANDTLTLTAGFALGNTKFIRVSSSAATVSFTAGVSEIS
jgi:hypothetical protein